MTTTKNDSLSVTERRGRLERRANVIRSRLLRTIDALDHRRHQVAEVTHHAKRVAKPAAIVVVGFVVGCAAIGLGIRALVRSRREKHLSYRLSHMLERFQVQKRPSILEDVVRKLAVSVTTIVAAELAKRTAKNLLDGRGPLQLPAGRASGRMELAR